MIFLSQYKFSKFGEFILRAENRELHYESNGAFDCLETPKVYCCIVQQNSNNEKHKVLYVGKTKSSIKGRMGQHRQEFKKRLNRKFVLNFVIPLTGIFFCFLSIIFAQ